ncbi:MAG: hypothetical protein WHT27_05875 [candidate division WOR-3 bacterium]
MKKFLPIFLLLIFLSCVKKYDTTQITSQKSENLLKNEIKNILLSTYEYNIMIKHEFLDVSFKGEKDPLNRFTLKGYFNILDQKNFYDHIFTGEEWIRRRDLKKETDDIIDIPLFIENIIDKENMELKSFENGAYIFDVKVNTALMDPTNYLQKGFLYYYPQKKKIFVTLVEKKNFQVNIQFKDIGNIKFKDKYFETSINVFGNRKDIEILNERFVQSDLGKIQNNRVYLNFDIKKFNFDVNILLEDSLSFYRFKYVSPDNEGNDILYMNFDLRNTVLKEEKMLTIYGKEFFVEKKGDLYNVNFKDVDLDEDYEMVCKLGKFSFHSKYTKINKILMIKDLNEKVLAAIIVINKFPFDFKDIYIKEE